MIEVENISVEFPLYQGANRSLKKALLATVPIQRNLHRIAKRFAVRALSDVSFEVRDGDRLALLGRNGSGKTTLLKVLAGIYEPIAGRVVCHGSTTALLESSLGLDPDSTGRENILLRGMYMGIHPRAMRDHVADVEIFTELGPYLDMPVRTYSNGMMLRLAFAASTCVRSEILLMDEWLATGDIHFMEKAQKRLEDYITSSSVLVLASHSLDILRRWCNRGLLLDNGTVLADGAIDEVIRIYSDMP